MTIARLLYTFIQTAAPASPLQSYPSFSGSDCICSVVVLVLACPARPETVTSGTPAAICIVIFVCRREWTVRCGRPASSQTLCTQLSIVPGCRALAFLGHKQAPYTLPAVPHVVLICVVPLFVLRQNGDQFIGDGDHALTALGFRFLLPC